MHISSPQCGGDIYALQPSNAAPRAVVGTKSHWPPWCAKLKVEWWNSRLKEVCQSIIEVRYMSTKISKNENYCFRTWIKLVQATINNNSRWQTIPLAITHLPKMATTQSSIQVEGCYPRKKSTMTTKSTNATMTMTLMVVMRLPWQ